MAHFPAVFAGTKGGRWSVGYERLPRGATTLNGCVKAICTPSPRYSTFFKFIFFTRLGALKREDGALKGSSRVGASIFAHRLKLLNVLPSSRSILRLRAKGKLPTAAWVPVRPLAAGTFVSLLASLSLVYARRAARAGARFTHRTRYRSSRAQLRECFRANCYAWRSPHHALARRRGRRRPARPRELRRARHAHGRGQRRGLRRVAGCVEINQCVGCTR